MEDGSTLTSEKCFLMSIRLANKVSACHSSAQITGSAFDVFSPLRMTASSVRQTEKWGNVASSVSVGPLKSISLLPVTVSNEGHATINLIISITAQSPAPPVAS